MFAAALLAYALQTSPSTDPFRGAALYAQCKDTIRTSEGNGSAEAYASGGLCVGYLNGFSDGSAEAICINGANLQSMVRVYVDFMGKHPALLDEAENVGAKAALQQAYPCRKRP